MIIIYALFALLSLQNLQAMEDVVIKQKTTSPKTKQKMESPKEKHKKGSRLLASSSEDDFSLVNTDEINVPDEHGDTVLHHAYMCLIDKASKRLRRINNLLRQGAETDTTNDIGLKPRAYFLISLGDRNMRDLKTKAYKATLETCKALGVDQDLELLSASLSWHEIPGSEENEHRPGHGTWPLIDYLKYMAAEYKMLSELKQLMTDLFGPHAANKLIPEIK